MDWFDLLAVQRTLKSLLQHHRSKASTDEFPFRRDEVTVYDEFPFRRDEVTFTTLF